MSDDPFAPVNSDTRTRRVGGVELENVVPVPAGIAAAPTSHPKLGKPTQIWTYHDAAGGVLGYIHRYPVPGSKTYRPVTLWRPAAGGKPKWRWESWPPPRPLYGLQRLAERPSALVVVVEGEKAADACQRLLPGVVAVSAPNGANSASMADWSPLKGRQVTIWPDADVPGLKYGRIVAKLIAQTGAAVVAVVSPPTGVKVDWDAADALSEGWNEIRATELISSARPFSDVSPRPRTKGQKDDLIGTVVSTDGLELWRDAGGATYATVPMNGHVEHWPLRSVGFERWLSGIHYYKNGRALSTQGLEDVRRTLDIRAYNEGLGYEPFVRVGARNGKLYLDLCDRSWRAIEIGPHGWEIIDRPPIKFLRSSSSRALPEPIAGEGIERLRGFTNVGNEDDFKLVVAWLVSSLRVGLPFCILIINGTQGSGKSVLCRLLRSLIDPDIAPLCAVPKDERDFVLAASNTWISAFDNLSDVTGFLPDALCRLTNGTGFRTRALHTNREESVFAVQRPVLLNGIPTLTEQADVARRSIVINLPSINSDQRQTEDEFCKQFTDALPYILGALCDAESCALRNIDSVQLVRPGSLPDFEKWSIAAAPGLGWEAGEFEAAYRRNQSAVADETFESDEIAVAIDKLITTKQLEVWDGTMTALWTDLDNDAIVPERIRKSRFWPKTVAQLGNRVKRAKPILEHKGYTVKRKHSGTRSITIIPPTVSPK